MNLRDCPFHLTPEGVWICPQCKHEYPRPAAKRPRRTCPAAPPAKEATRRHVERRIADKHLLELATVPPEESARRLGICMICPIHNGSHCAEITGCVGKAQERWIDRIVKGNCEVWQ